MVARLAPAYSGLLRDINPSAEGLTAQPHIFGGGLVDSEHNPKSPMV